MHAGGGRMAEGLETLAAKPDDLSSVPQVVLWLAYTHGSTNALK